MRGQVRPAGRLQFDGQLDAAARADLAAQVGFARGQQRLDRGQRAGFAAYDEQIVFSFQRRR